jgi:iron complex outermembrane receptor protein
MHATDLGRPVRYGLASVSILALMTCMPGAAIAQQAGGQSASSTTLPDTVDGTIVITGIRHGLAEAIDKKRLSLSIIESIVAEDIGKLPNVSIADSLAQLPGLALQRVDGRPQLATIRGFGPDFTASFLNERPIASARFSRAVSFDQYPAELLAGVDVYKTPNLDLAGMGLAGTIDLRTVHPLESKNTFAFNVKGIDNSLGHVNPDVSNKGFSANGTYIHKFADDTIGFSIGYSHMDSPEAIQHTKDWYYGSNPGNVSPASAAGDQFLEGFEATATSRRLVRDGVSTSLEWKPNEKIHNTLDLFYSQFYQQETSRTLEGYANPSANTNAAYTGVTTANVGGTNVAQSGTLSNWNGDILESSNPEKEWLFAVGDRLEYAPSSRLKFALDLSYSQDHDKQSEIQTQAGYLNPTGSAMPFAQNDTLGFNVPFGASGFPQFSTGLNYANASNIGLGDPGTSAWGGWGQDGTIHDYDIMDKVYTADLGGRYAVNSGLFENFDFGVNYEHHDKIKTITEDNLFLAYPVKTYTH